MISEFIQLLIVGFVVSGVVDIISAYYNKPTGATIWMVILTILYGIGRFVMMWVK